MMMMKCLYVQKIILLTKHLAHKLDSSNTRCTKMNLFEIEVPRLGTQLFELNAKIIDLNLF